MDTKILIGAAVFILIVVIGLVVFVVRVALTSSRRAPAQSVEKEREPVTSAPTFPATRGQGGANAPEAYFAPGGRADWERDSNSLPEMPVVRYNEQRHVTGSSYERFSVRMDGAPNNAVRGVPPVQDARKRYEQGMRVSYDADTDALALIFTDVVMNTASDVSLAFDVVMEKMQAVMNQQGMERCAWHADIAGLVIGGDATNIWGQTLKRCLDALCIKVQGGYYLAAHYNSRASRPSEEQIREKVKRIQFMTSAAINGFQSNIFDTREEAIAYLMRMRELAVRR